MSTRHTFQFPSNAKIWTGGEERSALGELLDAVAQSGSQLSIRQGVGNGIYEVKVPAASALMFKLCASDLIQEFEIAKRPT